jgi:hypothetical protein
LSDILRTADVMLRNEDGTPLRRVGRDGPGHDVRPKQRPHAGAAAAQARHETTPPPGADTTRGRNGRRHPLAGPDPAAGLARRLVLADQSRRAEAAKPQSIIGITASSTLTLVVKVTEPGCALGPAAL